MCGIIGAVQKKNTVKTLLSGLHALEYRGYDSAGIAVLGERGISLARSVGKVKELEALLRKKPIAGMTGIAHTRWATHGEPSERNAHPHVSKGDIAVVHNGIIENYHEIRAKLQKRGYDFVSDTDTEAIAHLVHYYVRKEGSLLAALKRASKELRGAYAVGVISAKEPGKIAAARFGSPLVLGLGSGENFIASSPLALLSETSSFVYLENGDTAEISGENYSIFDSSGHPVARSVKKSELRASDTTMSGYPHFMLKEIHEQPEAIEETLEGRIANGRVIPSAFGRNAKKIFEKIKAVQIVACGTSYHSGLIARYWMEPLADIPCQADVASEWRYREPRLRPDTLYVFISQSGETADTLACLQMVKKEVPAASTLAICNVPESAMTREADFVFLTRAGQETGVASTKAFTTQLVALMFLTLSLGQCRKTLSKSREEKIVSEMIRLPSRVSRALALDSSLRSLASRFTNRSHALYLGRGSQYPIALEGALKLKEISYIHAEGYQAGELKHGPLALVDEEMPVIAVAPNDRLAEKLQSNLREVRARKGKLFIFAAPHVKIERDEGTEIISLPEVGELLAPVVCVVPLQLFAYHVAVLRGNDVDRPRNLAKSVTVE